MRAENETRTRDPNLGKVVLYQLSYFRNMVPRTGLEPACLSTHAPETCASTIPPPGLSGKRDSNSRPQPWQGCALPTELFPQSGEEKETRTPTTSLSLPPQSSASTNSAISPINKLKKSVPRTGLEPACLSTHAPETCASTIPPPGLRH